MKGNNKYTTIEIPHTSSRIGKGAEYNGVLQFKTSMSIMGKMKGEIHGGELLIVHPNAIVEGDISVNYLLVIGSVYGNMNIKRGVYFFENALIRGNITSAIIRMQSGVNFDGTCNLSIEDEVDIFSLTRENYYSTLFDKLVHELDDIV